MALVQYLQKLMFKLHENFMRIFCIYDTRHQSDANVTLLNILTKLVKGTYIVILKIHLPSEQYTCCMGRVDMRHPLCKQNMAHAK